MRYQAPCLLPLLLAACIPSPDGEPPGGYEPVAEGRRAAPPPVARPSARSARRSRPAADIDAPIRTVPLDRATTPSQVADPPPAWTARKVVADAQDVADASYTVAAGDTLQLRLAASGGAVAILEPAR